MRVKQELLTRNPYVSLRKCFREKFGEFGCVTKDVVNGDFAWRNVCVLVVAKNAVEIKHVEFVSIIAFYTYLSKNSNIPLTRMRAMGIDIFKRRPKNEWVRPPPLPTKEMLLHIMLQDAQVCHYQQDGQALCREKLVSRLTTEWASVTCSKCVKKSAALEWEQRVLDVLRQEQNNSFDGWVTTPMIIEVSRGAPWVIYAVLQKLREANVVEARLANGKEAMKDRPARYYRWKK